MSNTFTSGARALSPSNGATSVLISVLALAASRRARHDWQRELAVGLAVHDQSVFGLGVEVRSAAAHRGVCGLQ